MILQALANYYERKQACGDHELPRYGFETKSIPVIVEINRQGELIQLRKEEKEASAAQYIVPQGVKKTSGIAANLLWDNAEYALGIVVKSTPERVTEQHQAFKDKIQSLGKDVTSDEGVTALLKFFSKLNIAMLQKHIHWEYLQTNPTVSFQLQGDAHLICERPIVIEAVTKQTNDEQPALCLVSGEKDVPERLHCSIKGVWGAQSSGANIVSFNWDASNSYEKKQGFNAPVGKRMAFAYTTALNYLLKKGSTQRIQIGDASTVFWSAEPTEFESEFSTIWGATPKKIKENPERYKEAVKSVYTSISRGSYVDDDRDTEFYVLGLSPNASRISIRFWLTGTVREFSHRIKQHFEYLAMVHSERDIDVLPLFVLLVNVATQGKTENIPPNLAGEVIQSILTGRPYPFTLFAAAIRRCKAEQSVNYPRAAIIKAYLNRLTNKEELTMALDKENVNTAYRLGRLFATLEKIQEEASPGLNATIRDRYYGSASSNPVNVFSTLLKLKNHHLSKLENPGRKTNFEKLLGEIMQEMSVEFPSTLSIQDQGRFAVGYYHQRQDFFTKKIINETGE